MRNLVLISIMSLAGPAWAGPGEAEQDAPRVVVEPAEVGNPVKAFRAIMLRVVRSHRAELVACLESHPDRAGTLILAFTVEPDGRLAAVRAVDRGGLPAELVDCVVSRVAGWRVPEPRGGVPMQVRYPLELRRPKKSSVQAQVRRGGPRIEGALTKDQIQGFIREHLADVRACWEADLRPCPALHAKLVVRIEVGPDGAVTQAQVTQNTSARKQLEDCVLKAVRGWRFPKPKDGARVTISYPFVFAVP